MRNRPAPPPAHTSPVDPGRRRALGGIALLFGAVTPLASIATLSPGCRRGGEDTGLLRLGMFPNVTHAPGLTGVESGRFAQALAPLKLDVKTFNAGPAAIEALLAEAVDATYVGPSPVLAAFTRTGGSALRVVAGAASGGAVLVVRPAANIHGPADLHGKRLASPQLGNTQDVALRAYLREHGLATTDRGGDVTVVPLSNPDILGRFHQGDLDGAWVPEPWGSRLVAEAGAQVLLDERDLWPGRRFPTTVLAVRKAFLDAAPDAVAKLVRAHADEVARINADAAAARALTNRALARLQGRPLPDALLESAWGRIDFTTDPLEQALAVNARHAHELGFLPGESTAGLVDTGILRRVAPTAR